MKLNDSAFHPPKNLLLLCGGLAVLGGGALAVGLFQDPKRAWLNLLLVSYFLLSLGLGGLVFIALQYVSGAGWSVSLRRVPEAMAAILPVAALGLGLVFLVKPSVYPWVDASAEEVASFPPWRRAWFSLPFFLARFVVYFAGWILLARVLVRTSRRQDSDGKLAHTSRSVQLSAAFLVFFGLSFWLASTDWLMSLEPEWASTVFAVYHFSGVLLAGVAGIVVLGALLQWLGVLHRVLVPEHVHDLGKLLFGFSTFWMYLWLCQYLLIWYVNNPEETAYFTRRLDGAWRPLLLVSIVLNWGVPFLVLLPSATKRRLGVLVVVSLVVLAGRWVDLYLAILPSASGQTASPSVWEIGMILGGTGLFVMVFLIALGKAATVPVGDPYLVESLPANTEHLVSSGS
jgi:hypothetical protein